MASAKQSRAKRSSAPGPPLMKRECREIDAEDEVGWGAVWVGCVPLGKGVMC